MGVAGREREALADLLLSVGPDAPTLCDGWTTTDLAVHLLIRERRPDAAVGILAPALSRWTARVSAGMVAGRSFGTLVGAVRTAPPLWPTRLPGVDDLANALEFLVHHEDVRRAVPGWAPRPLPDADEAVLRRPLRLLGPVLLRRPPVPLRLVLPDGRTLLRHRAKGDRHGDEVTVTGPLLELVLYAYGRRQVADVALRGTPAARAAVAATALGL